MAKRIAITNLNASTLDILNTIRANLGNEYQSSVPEITDIEQIPAVGEIIRGYPTLANQFINALVNRIALVRVKSATFNNAYAELKKGYLEFGETVEEVFVNIAKAREFSVEKAEARELKRSLPDVRTAFHCMNWRVQYPVTIQYHDLEMAFTSVNGVQDLIAKIVAAVYTGAEYDEFLLFKYLIIKGIAHGQMKPISFDASDVKNAAVAFRGASNKLTFMSKEYNAEGVTTATPKRDQYIFMDADFNATYDVNVLAAAFNMDKAEFSGKLKLIDDFASFDNERFAEIRENTDMLEEVTAEELAIMRNVKAVLVDAEWFQVYDNHNRFTEKYVASGEYWNYFYNVWKTVSSSPFSNAVVFVDDAVNISNPTSVEVQIVGKQITDGGTAVFTLSADYANAGIANGDVHFEQNDSATTAGIAVHSYGAIIVPADKAYVPTATINGVEYSATTTNGGDVAYQLENDSVIGATFYLTPIA